MLFVCVCVNCWLLEVGWFGLINNGLGLSRDTFVPQLASAYHQMGEVAMVKLKDWKNHEVNNSVFWF